METGAFRTVTSIFINSVSLAKKTGKMARGYDYLITFTRPFIDEYINSYLFQENDKI